MPRWHLQRYGWLQGERGQVLQAVELQKGRSQVSVTARGRLSWRPLRQVRKPQTFDLVSHKQVGLSGRKRLLEKCFKNFPLPVRRCPKQRSNRSCFLINMRIVNILSQELRQSLCRNAGVETYWSILRPGEFRLFWPRTRLQGANV
jgi:hypothetical protein